MNNTNNNKTENNQSSSDRCMFTCIIEYLLNLLSSLWNQGYNHEEELSSAFIASLNK